MDKSTLGIEFFDFDSGKKIENGKAEIKNVDNKTVEIHTIVNGKVTVNIAKENIADFYSVRLINDDGSKQSPYFLAKMHKEINGEMVLADSLQKLIAPRSYEKCNAKLYFKQCESPTNQYKVGIIKCYKIPHNESMDKKRQEAYHYCDDSKDEIFVADKEQTIALQAYFYKDLEVDKLLSQKNREILSNKAMQSCVKVGEMQWNIKAVNKQYTFKGNPIFVNLKDFGFKNDDILTIRAELKKSQENNYIQSSKVHYREPFKADGTLFEGKLHTVIDALGEMRLAIEDRYALVYDYRGLFLYENRCEVCKLNINNGINDTKIEKLNDYIDFKKKKYEAEISGKTQSTISIHIKVNANQTIALTFDCNNSDALSFFNHKQIGSTIHFIYYKPTQYVIVINRHTQTTKYTLSNYQILKQTKNGEYEPLRNEIDKIASGVILEPCGPDGLLADTVLRIPQGHYKIKQHTTQAGLREYMIDSDEKPQRELPKLYDNEFVLSDNSDNKKRTDILIHAGTNVLESPLDRTEGCLLIGKEFDNGKLMTHSDYNSDIQRIKNNVKKEFEPRETKTLEEIQKRKANKEFANYEAYEKALFIAINKVKKEVLKSKEIPQSDRVKIEKYNNVIIRMLMKFINNKYANFSVHIKNNFSKEEYDVRMV